MIIIQKHLEVYHNITEISHIITDSESFRSKTNIIGNTPADGNTKVVEIIVAIKYLSHFWRNPRMPLINCETNLILTWPSTCVISNSIGIERFAIIESKLYVPVVTL